jgi:hypothetical protein
MLYDPSCPDYLVRNETDKIVYFCKRNNIEKQDFGKWIFLDERDTGNNKAPFVWDTNCQSKQIKIRIGNDENILKMDNINKPGEKVNFILSKVRYSAVV